MHTHARLFKNLNVDVSHWNLFVSKPANDTEEESIKFNLRQSRSYVYTCDVKSNNNKEKLLQDIFIYMSDAVKRWRIERCWFRNFCFQVNLINFCVSSVIESQKD